MSPGETKPSASQAEFRPLHHSQQMAEMIAAITHKPVEVVLDRLRDEHEHLGKAVSDDFRRRRLTPYVWNDELVRFYEQTDGFLYELALWNRNRVKRQMRRWIGRRLEAASEGPSGMPDKRLDVLALGDGLGFDCLELAKSGHRVTYFEVPGLTESFARMLFAKSGVKVTVITDPKLIPKLSFNAVVCLDVLEHVPDPQAFVGDIVQYLRPGGLLLVHAPFYMIHPDYPTHLKANRAHAGSMALYLQHGLTLVDGQPFWNPLVFSKGPSATPPMPGAGWRLALLRLAGMWLRLGRYATWPLYPVHMTRHMNRKWFDD